MSTSTRLRDTTEQLETLYAQIYNRQSQERFEILLDVIDMGIHAMEESECTKTTSSTPKSNTATTPR